MSAVEQLRAAQDRDVRLVGVPMFVVLRDETVDPATGPGAARLPADLNADADARAEADTDPLAARLDELRAGLGPSQREGDLGVVASLLGLAAHLDLHAGHGP